MSLDWEKILSESGITLTGIDIGCSSGRPHQWERFGDALQYVGIDPLENEIKRLNDLNHPNSRYIPGLLTFEGVKGHADEGTVKFFRRTSASYDQQSGYDQKATTFNSGLEVIENLGSYSVLDLLKDFKGKPLDLLKIDIDGDDFLAMKAFFDHGMGENLLMLDIESQFHGDVGEKGNTIWNIGKLANEKELFLYDITINRYSRSLLPSKYVYDFPAQTRFGQVLWGDSLFFRDSVNENLANNSIIKLIALYEVFDLFDCALEALLTHEVRINKIIPTAEIAKALRDQSNRRENANSQNEPLPIALKRIVKKLLR
jgi:hypothetical protein